MSKQKINGGAVKPKKINVFLGIPTIDTGIGMGVLWIIQQSVTETLKPGGKYRINHLVQRGVKPVEFMWNKLVQAFLGGDHKIFWKVDNDMFPLNNFFDLLDVDADICAGLFLRYEQHGLTNPGKFNVCAYNLAEDGTPLPIAPKPTEGPILDVDAVGGGCMLIRRHVLEDKRMLLDDAYTDIRGQRRTLGPEEAPPIFRRQYKANGECIQSADIDFCLRAKKLGYSVKVHLNIPVDQQVTVGLNGVLASLRNREQIIADQAENPSIVLAN